MEPVTGVVSEPQPKASYSQMESHHVDDEVLSISMAKNDIAVYKRESSNSMCESLHLPASIIASKNTAHGLLESITVEEFKSTESVLYQISIKSLLNTIGVW